MSAGMAMAKASYRGDPGIFGFLGKAVGAVAGAIPGVGTAVKIAGGLLGGIGTRKVATSTIRRVGGAVARTGVSAGALGPIAAAATIPPLVKQGAGILAKGVGAVATGYGIGKGIEAIGGLFKGKKKYRRMNPTNPRALKRAIRRVERFGEVARACGYSRPPRAIRGCKTPTRKKRTPCR